MKRVLLFVLLFGLGLTALLLFRGKDPRRDDVPSVEAPAPAGEFTELPMGQKEGQPGKAIGVVLDGPLSITMRGGSGTVLRPEIELRARDVDSVGGEVYDLHDLGVDWLDPETGTRRARLQSPRARATLIIDPTTPGASALTSAKLQDVDITLFEGAPVVPLRFRSPTGDLDVKQIGFTTPDRVRVDGTGLEAQGTGLRAGFGEERVVLDRNASITLNLEGDVRAVLKSGAQGSLVIQRVERDGQPTLDVVASEGASLTILGGERAPKVGEVSIDARTIHLVGRGPTEERSGYELVSADARGDVVAKSGSDEFRAQQADFGFGARGRLVLATLDEEVLLRRLGDDFRARSAVFEFGQDAKLSRATLNGEPTGDVGVGRFLAPERPDLAEVRAKISGAGPLIVKLEEGVDIDLLGPARVEVPGTTLDFTAQEKITGKVATDRKSGELHARGDVVIDYEGRKLSGPLVDLTWTLDATSVLTVEATSTGATSLRGITPGGRPVTLDATGGVQSRWTGDKLLVPAAQGVTLTIGTAGTPEHVLAKAQRVTDLDWEARTFQAEGDVTFESVDGDGDAARAVVRGERDVELYGSEAKRASYRLRRTGQIPEKDMHIETFAREIRATERRMTARGDVHLDAEVDVARLDLDAQFIETEVAPEVRGSLAARPFFILARDAVRGRLARGDESAQLEAAWVRVDGRLEPHPGEEPPLEAYLASVEARGDVHVTYAGDGELDGRADRFTVDGQGRGRLSAGAGKRVTATGRMGGALAAYTISADWIDFDPETIRASRVEGGLQDPGAPSATGAFLREMRARSIEATRDQILFDGDAHIAGTLAQGDEWSLDAGSIRIQGDFRDPSVIHSDRVRSLVAQGGFVAQMGSRGEARGEKLEGVPGQMRFEGRPAELRVLDAEWRAPWIEYDMTNMLLATDKGEIVSRPGAPGTSWALEYESMQPFDQGETTILVLRNPRLRYGSAQLVADWTLFWVDRDKWQSSGRRVIKTGVGEPDLLVREPEDPGQPVDDHKPSTNPLQAKLDDLKKSPIFQLLSEVYVEGNVEIYDVGVRHARAGALYFDLVEEHGWVQDADFQVDIELRGEMRKIRAKAEWLRISSGPVLRADTAVLTACEFDDPHYVVETTDLRLTPQINTVDERVAFQVTAEGNAIRFGDGLRVPMPPLVYETDSEGNPLIDRLVLGNSAKFGTAIGASINAQLGGIGLAVGKFAQFAFGLPDIPIKGGWNFDVRYLGSRGLLLGVGLDLRLGDKLDFNAQVDTIPDRDNDSGLVRVDRDDRSLLRTWMHSRGRYWLERGDDAQWVDLAFSYQTDAGVQSEFFENDYLEYEQKDNYLHWRKANGSDYYSATAKAVIEDRTDIAELPSAGAFRGRTEVGQWWKRPLYYTGSLDAAYLDRHEGDPRYYAPYIDGLGERQVLRADTRQRLELPFALGLLNANATPFVEARGNAWSEGVDEEETPVRAALIVGLEATTTLWKRSSGGSAHTLSPTIGVHGSVADYESGGDPVHFDTTENPYVGQFLDVGFRARWWKPEEPDQLELEVRASLGENVEGPQEDGLQPIEVLGGYFTVLGGFPFAVTQDGRYDPREGQTQYSMTGMGFEPLRNLGLEFGHHYGRDASDDTLYEAASARARWRWTTKWEMEATQTQSLLESKALGTEFVLRRLGHDFVFEIELGYRAGEGTRFGFGFQPRLSWRRKSLGLIDQWLGIYH